MAQENPIDVQQVLKGAHYPARGKDLARLAEDNKASSDVVRRLQAHSKDTYNNPTEVQKDVFGTG
ncbi:hypothetical protein VR41_02350 [Streptomyces sp. NRRL B-1568]|uniref:DUF2795 domain-containing protein n=1 Tax=Streptomyces olivoverticillatus TaxID=66427 RepID=A0A7W7LPL5_9ACTN|nr:DUF2795 domain-containing protein [Streptomyces olivoverticillatus]KJY43629.1 hypothetical protein VR41_02350 [Streptomyces sp. NRRL B-1568]MBB4893939.1 hypothetical protein [Streptomyces olivoverticillatus]